MISDVDSGAPLNLPGIFPGNNFINYHQNYPDENAGFRDESKTQTDINPQQSTDVHSIYMLNEVLLSGYRLKYLASYFEYDYDKLVDSDAIVAARSQLNWDNLYLGGVPVSTLTGISRTAPMVTEITAQDADFTSHDLQLYSEFSGNLNFVAGLYYYQGNEDQMYAVHEANDELMAVYTFLGNLVGRNTSTENWLYRGEPQGQQLVTYWLCQEYQRRSGGGYPPAPQHRAPQPHTGYPADRAAHLRCAPDLRVLGKLVRIRKHALCIHGAFVGPNLFKQIKVLASRIGRMNSALHGI